MRKLLFPILLISVVLEMPVVAASLDRLAEDLSRRADSLAEEAYRGFQRRDRGNRADVEALYVTLQFRSSADLFRRMLRDRRPESELRDSVDILRTELSRMNRYAFGRREREQMDGIVQTMARELSPRRDSNRGRSEEIGRMRWSGRVDDEAMVLVQGSRVSIRNVSGDRVKDEKYTFDSALPRADVVVRVEQRAGRGSVDLVEQPSRRNDFTAVIRISDKRGGSDRYEFELVW
jgi:hypothetical protein